MLGTALCCIFLCVKKKMAPPQHMLLAVHVLHRGVDGKGAVEASEK